MIPYNKLSHLEDCKTLLKKWSESGLNQSEYCRQHKISLSAFKGRLLRARQALLKEAADKNKIVPLIIKAQSSTELASPPIEQIVGITLRHANGWQLSLPVNVSPQWLGALLQSLQ